MRDVGRVVRCVSPAGLRLKESGKDGQADQRGKEVVWSKRRLQTLVASSDGKGQDWKTSSSFRKRGLMGTTGNLGAKRDSNPLFPKEPCGIFFVFVFLVPSDPVIVFDTIVSNK